MSDLGQLFRLSTAGPKPLENFTTTALAIAVRHDHRPILEALRRLEGTPSSLASTVSVPADDHRRIAVKADTQVALWRDDGTLGGYLDLVLTLTHLNKSRTLWVEVKVDAWEHGEQIEFYLDRAEKLGPPPEVITLGRTQVTARVRHLTWRTVVDAIEAVSNPHYTWISLRDFLLEERIALARITSPLADGQACVELLVDANKLVRENWPGHGHGLVWQPGRLKAALLKQLQEHPDRDLLVPAGPIRYGILQRDGIWVWGISLSVARNFEGVKLDPKEVLHDIAAAGLPQEWEIYPDRPDILERTLAAGSLHSSEEILEWLGQGFRDLREGNVLRAFFAGLAAKRRRPTTTPAP